MKVSAKADYAVRAAAELAAAQDTGSLVRAETIATAQGIPQRFLENILSDLRHAGLVQSQRGAEGGHRLNRPAAEISVADIIRAVDGPLAAVRGERPESVTYAGPAEPLQRVWIAVRKNLRDVVEEVSLADLAGGHAAGAGQRARRRSRGLGRPAEKAGRTAPWYFSSMNCLTSGEVSSAASFFTRGSCASSGSVTRRFAFGLFSAASSTSASLDGVRPPSIA